MAIMAKNGQIVAIATFAKMAKKIKTAKIARIAKLFAECMSRSVISLNCFAILSVRRFLLKVRKNLNL